MVTPSVLLIEPDYFWREILSRHFSSLGINFLHYHYGRDALRFAIRNSLSIVITELVLPDMHGLDLIRQLRDLPHAPKLRIVVLTNDTNRANIEECLNCAVSDYLVKSEASIPSLLSVISKNPN